ncbi:hypothetical protein AAFN85_23055 [Mucilaginibacter sp. CAU 1740]
MKSLPQFVGGFLLSAKIVRGFPDNLLYIVGHSDFEVDNVSVK